MGVRAWRSDRKAAHYHLLNLVGLIGCDLHYWNAHAKSEAKEALAFLGCSDHYLILVGDDEGELYFDLAEALNFDGLNVYAGGPH